MLTSLYLENFRSHAHTKVSFRKGTNLIIGIMGAGKSSILDGICFALFGTFPALERRKRKLDDIIKNGADHAKVRLEITQGEHSYAIERVLERTKRGAKSEAYVYKDSKLIDSTTTSVNEYVSQSLGIDYELYTRAVYSEQNNIDHFLSLDPKARKEQMDALLGLDKFETARTNATSVHNRIRSLRTVKLTEYDANAHGIIREEITKAQEKIIQLTKRKEELETLAKTKATHVEALDLEYVALSKQKLAFENHKNKLREIETIIKELSSAKQVSHEQLALAKEEIAALEKELTTLGAGATHKTNEYNSLAKKHGQVEQAIKQAVQENTKIDTYEKELKSVLGTKTLALLIEEDEVLKKELVEKKSLIPGLNKEILDIQKSLSHSPVEEHCPVCEQALDAKTWEKIKEGKLSREKQCKEAIATYEKEITLLIQQSAAKRSTIERAKVLEAQLSKAKRIDIDSLEKEKNSIEEQGNAIRKEIEGMNAILEAKRKAQKEKTVAHAALEKEYANSVRKKSLETECEKLKTTLPSFDTLRFDAITKEMMQARVDFEGVKKDMQVLGKETELAQHSLTDILQKEAKASKAKNELTELESLEQEMGVYKQALLETQLELRTQLVEAINTTMNSIWNAVYPYRDYQNIRLIAEEKDYACEVFDGTWKSLESVASGGERACAALVLRVALSMVLTPSFPLLVLDEPTHNLDKGAIELLSHTLQFKVPEVIDQTVVITHEEGLMGSEFASSYRLLRNKSAGEATTVEEI